MRRSLIALATAATIAITAATPARADGGATAAWIIGGIAVAALLVAATYPPPAYAYYRPYAYGPYDVYGPYAPAYYDGPYVSARGPACYWSNTWDAWGWRPIRICY